MKKLLTLILALAFLFSCFALADNESNFVTNVKMAKVVSEDGVSSALYELPGEYRNITEMIENGTSIYVTYEGTTWHKVKLLSGKIEGWMKASEVNITTKGYSAFTSGNSITYARTISSKDGVAALRWGPDTMYDKIDDLTNDTIVFLYETCGSWSRVLTEDGRVGYIASSLLRKATMPEEWTNILKGYIQVTGNSANIRKGASFSAKSLTYLKSGTVVDVYGKSGQFFFIYIEDTGEFGYAHADIISPAGLNRTIYETDVYYDNPFEYTCDVMTTIKADTTVKVLANDGSVSRVQFSNDVIGYIINTDLIY